MSNPILNDVYCTGCSACFNICPTNAITMEESQEGFLEPVINKDKCTNCGMCQKICPVLNTKYENSDKPDCFAYMADDEIRKNSSSGGAFYILAKDFIDNGGYVAGAVWTEGWKVKHIVSNKIEDIERMRKSKYLQSEIGYCYKEIKNLLEDDKKVLFTGCPCQVAGLKSYLKKEYKNLFCIDIVCHSVPSPKVFEKYLTENYKLDEIKHIDFRDKMMNGWVTTLRIDKIDNSDYFKTTENPYLMLFLKNIITRKSCGDCLFNKLPRQGDITLGDFWGIDKKYNDNKGTSLILVNNKKGELLSEILKCFSKLYVRKSLDEVVKKNPMVICSSKSHKHRDTYFSRMKKYTVLEAYEQLIENKCDYLIINFWDSKFNYGACITAWAIQEMLKAFGLNPKHLDTGERTKTKWYKNSYMENFAKRYLDTTSVLNYKQCKNLSKNIKGAILGSDQVLRIKYYIGDLKKYLLSFIDNSKKKIAISASFGVDKEEFIEENKNLKKEKEYMAAALSTFNYLSTREVSGKEIYKDIFGLESDFILDPVFLIEKEKYNEIIINSSKTGKDKIVSYVLDGKEEYNKLYKHLEEKYQKPVEQIDRMSGEYKVEDWLILIKECDYFITDSFHGVCFAIIFNKPFICLNNSKRGSARLQTLIDIFGISENIKNSIEEVYNTDLQFNKNYSQINQIIEKERRRCLEIIRKVLLENYSNNKNSERNKTNFEKLEQNYKKNKQFLYYKYKILANITFGETRKRYKKKKKEAKKIIKDESFKI